MSTLPLRAAALPAILVLATALRCYRLDGVALWTDELFTASYPRLGLGELWSTGLRAEPTSPLYYTLIWGIECVAGSSAWALRLPSVVASVATVWLGARLAREISDRPNAPLVAALLLALFPTLIFYAQEARAYALQIAAIALALLGFARFLADGRRVVLFAIGALLAIWLHPTSILAVAAIDVAALACLAGGMITPRAFGRWLLANAAVALCCLPLVPVLTSPGTATATAWIEKLTRWSLEGVLGTTLAGPALMPMALRVAEFGLPLLAILFLVPPWRPGRRALVVLLLVPLLFLAAMVGLSVSRPVLLSRTIAWTLVPLGVALADLLCRRPRGLGVAVVAVVALTTAVHLRDLAGLKEDWRGFLARLDLAPPALVVLAPHTSPAALAFYAPDAAAPVRLDDGQPPMPETEVTRRVFATPTIEPADMARAIAEGRRVWLIYRRPEFEWMRRVTAGLPPPAGAVQDGEGSNPGIRALRW